MFIGRSEAAKTGKRYVEAISVRRRVENNRECAVLRARSLTGSRKNSTDERIIGVVKYAVRGTKDPGHRFDGIGTNQRQTYL